MTECTEDTADVTNTAETEWNIFLDYPSTSIFWDIRVLQSFGISEYFNLLEYPSTSIFWNIRVLQSFGLSGYLNLLDYPSTSIFGLPEYINFLITRVPQLLDYPSTSTNGGYKNLIFQSASEA